MKGKTMDFKNLINEYPFKSEFHCHTSPSSKCGVYKPEKVVDMYLELGTDTLVITNHLRPYHFDDGRDAVEAAKYYTEDYFKAKKAAEGTGMNVALGIEIGFKNNPTDFLVYGVAPEEIEYIAPYVFADIHTFYREYKNDKNVILQAHPFRDNMDPTPIGSVDGVEAYNVRPHFNNREALAFKLARENDMLVSGASDFHKTEEGVCFARTKKHLRDSFDVAEVMKARDLIFDVYGSIIIPFDKF